MSNPVLVNTLRGEIIENRHRGAIAVCDPKGRLVNGWGDVDALVYPRSAIKPLQALPLLESGAADHFDLSSAELALACSSHSGEPLHTTTVHNWLTRLGLDDAALECGPHAPANEKAAPSKHLECVTDLSTLTPQEFLSSPKSVCIGITSRNDCDKAMYSASTVLKATSVCNLEIHTMGAFANVIT